MYGLAVCFGVELRTGEDFFTKLPLKILSIILVNILFVPACRVQAAISHIYTTWNDQIKAFAVANLLKLLSFPSEETFKMLLLALLKYLVQCLS